tara:strand:+ start:3614 stop:4801 length:1188 start_codon:yes stop_codon:yes gene_type:complete
MTTLNDTNINDVQTTEDVGIYETFESMGLSENIMKGIYAFGFEKPSAIQQKAIVPFMTGRDLIAQSQSGTGKTATFVIGMLQQLDENDKGLQAIILVPTRELAKQINDVVTGLCTYTKYKVNLVIGGAKRQKYSYGYDDEYQILVGTPGRLSEMVAKKSIDPSNLKVLIMDEADEMLSFGFREQMVKILNKIPKKTQIGLFSATIPEEMMKITTKFMNNPIKILIKTSEVTLEGIKQYYIVIENDEDKFDCLCDLYSTIRVTQSIIYVNHKSTVDWLSKNLAEKDFTVGSISGGMLHEERNDVMVKFRAGDIRVLISTDLLSRGIDVQQVSLVLNYDIPHEKETYIHRIGRSGRFGRKGVAVNFVNQKDYSKFKAIIDHYETTIQEMPENISSIM